MMDARQASFFSAGLYMFESPKYSHMCVLDQEHGMNLVHLTVLFCGDREG